VCQPAFGFVLYHRGEPLRLAHSGDISVSEPFLHLGDIGFVRKRFTGSGTAQGVLAVEELLKLAASIWGSPRHVLTAFGM
jgi:hypothetical protein